MSTGTAWIELGLSSLINLDDLTDNLRDATIAAVATGRLDAYGEDGTIGTSKVTLTYGGAQVLSVGAGVGMDNNGNRLVSDGLSPWASVPFLDTVAVTYQIGARYQLRPSSVTGNTADGVPVYDELVEDVGELGAPDLVTVAGAGLSIRVDTLAKTLWTDAAKTRPVVVYLVNPATGSADAIYSGTCGPNAGHIVIACPHQLGQATPSTTVADYRVIIRGPTIQTAALSSSYWVLGAVTSGVTTTVSQVQFLPWGTWSTRFLVEHNAAGAHTAITANTLSLSGTVAAKIQAKGFNGTDDTNNPKFQAMDSGNNALVEVYTDGSAGGRLRFPLANMGSTGGARIDVRGAAPGTVNLWITNDRGTATDYVDIHHDGVIRWNATKSANTWKLSTNQAAPVVLHVVNENGANTAGLTLDKGDLNVANGKATIGSTGVDLTGASAEINYLATRDRSLYLAAYFPTEFSGTILTSRASNPPYVQDNAAGALTLYYSLGTLELDPEASGMVLDTFSCYHNRASATGSIVATLYRADGQAGGAPVAVQVLTATSTAGTWGVTGMNVGGIAHTVLRTRHYWIELVINPSGDATLTNYKVHGFFLKFTKSKIG